MLVTGTFLKMSVKTDDDTHTPVILCPAAGIYYICLPEQETIFRLNYEEGADVNAFSSYMDGRSAKLVAAAVAQALKLIMLCGGDHD